MSATEPRHLLVAGDYAAVVSVVGAALHTLRHEGRDLVRATEDQPALPNYRGAVLVPWPNRVADGRYRVNGEQQQLAITEVERGCALHGLAARIAWQVADVRSDSVVLQHTIWPQPGYPFGLAVTAGYTLDAAAGLAVEVSAHNIGDAPAPYGTSIHPYLVGGPGRVDDWTLHLSADEVITVDPERLLPTGRQPVADSDFDFRTPRRIATTELDHAYTGVTFDEDGSARAELTAEDGSGVRMSWDSTCRYVQVHTADSSTGELFRSGLAFEPMTCAPDAFNSGDGLVLLAPEQQHSTRWAISAVC